MPSLTSNGGKSLNISAIISVVVGVISGAWLSGVADVIEAAFDAFLISPLQGLSSFLSGLITGLFGIPAAISEGAWSGATSIVALFGPFGLLIAVAIVVTTAYIIAVGVDYA